MHTKIAKTKILVTKVTCKMSLNESDKIMKLKINMKIRMIYEDEIKMKMKMKMKMKLNLNN